MPASARATSLAVPEESTFCNFCNLALAKAESRVSILNKTFHGDCFVKHLRKVNGERKADAERLAGTGVVVP